MCQSGVEHHGLAIWHTALRVMALCTNVSESQSDFQWAHEPPCDRDTGTADLRGFHGGGAAHIRNQAPLAVRAPAAGPVGERERERERE